MKVEYKRKVYQRLEMYEILKKRIAERKEDIENLRYEGMGVSGVLKVRKVTYREPVSVEERRQVQAMILERELARDEKLKEEIERGVKAVSVEYKLEGLIEDRIKEIKNLRKRERERVVMKLAVYWYGAEVIR